MKTCCCGGGNGDDVLKALWRGCSPPLWSVPSPRFSRRRRHTAPVAMLYWHYYNQEIRKASVVLTVHNFAQPGECRLEVRFLRL